jgi:hypothetical protein
MGRCGRFFSRGWRRVGETQALGKDRAAYGETVLIVSLMRWLISLLVGELSINDAVPRLGVAGSARDSMRMSRFRSRA